MQLNAFPAKSSSYPAAAQKLAHSTDVAVSMRRPMANHNPSAVRSAPARSPALSFENAISIDGVDGSCSRRFVGA